jgi:hypothetical protein
MKRDNPPSLGLHGSSAWISNSDSYYAAPDRSAVINLPSPSINSFRFGGGDGGRSMTTGAHCNHYVSRLDHHIAFGCMSCPPHPPPRSSDNTRGVSSARCSLISRIKLWQGRQRSADSRPVGANKNQWTLSMELVGCSGGTDGPRTGSASQGWGASRFPFTGWIPLTASDVEDGSGERRSTRYLPRLHLGIGATPKAIT